MKKTLYILGIVLIVIALPFMQIAKETLTAETGPVSEVREGDVIFQTSKSQQSPLIQIGTRSKITHCGIIVMRGGKPYVLETLKTLVLTPLDKFIARGEDGKYWIKRSSKENIKIKYAKYLGKPYDLAFKFDNGRFYCSELVYDIYQKQLGIQLAEPRQVKDYLILFTDRLPKLKRAMKRRGISKEQYAIAPVDIFNSNYLESVD
ncbi:MAG: hypothetical protein J6S07_01675 [Bacteroidaceae bacterium]|nr:hypothetical protein [Bacteroidaceae bacterium]